MYHIKINIGLYELIKTCFTTIIVSTIAGTQIKPDFNKGSRCLLN